MKIAILGWGSLLWEERPEFDKWHDDWQLDGPSLKLEFSRVSKTRKGALTLVIDAVNGSPCRVAYSFSKRNNPDDAICDLRSREGTTLDNIGCYFRDGSRTRARDPEALKGIQAWVAEHIDVVVWTDLGSNFETKSVHGNSFSVENAIEHMQSLDAEGKAKATEYVWRAPDFVDTPLRQALRSQP